MDTAMGEEEQRKLLAMCGSVFRPSGPINKLDLFAGRLGEIRKVTNAVNTASRHAILYGDRGVGKTSLASILTDLFANHMGMRIVKVNCSETDDFRNVWRKALNRIAVIEEMPNSGDSGRAPVERKLADLMNEDRHFGPGEVRELLESASQEGFELVIIFDEFDRLAADDRGLFSDAIKDVSDNLVSTTIILVAVANDVVDLIHDHASIDRCLAQINVPPMDRTELGAILSKAMELMRMSMEHDAAEWIVSLSQGYPHYTHLLGQEATFKAIEEKRRTVTLVDVNAGIKEALENTQQTVRDDYHTASQGQRKGTLFPQVLLACAMAEPDELGYFSSSDVRGPLCQITGKRYDIPNFSQHLDKFCSESRGPVLHKKRTATRFKFRFLNALLRPFIIMKGLKEGSITPELVQQVLGGSKRGGPHPSESELLFR